MKTYKKILSLALLLIILVSVCVIGFLPAGASGTGAGLSEWAMKAYNEGWSYVYGGSTPGAVDCSGLIYSYCGGARGGGSQLSSATATGYVSAGVPRIHGLGLYQPGHVGVYVGNGMAVDARGSQWGVCYQSVYTKSWTQWFKLAAITYPTNGWVKFSGNYYYYENGQYVVSCTKEIGGISYSFSSSGISDKTPADINAVANNKSTASETSATKATTAPTTAATTQSNVLKIGSSGDDVTKLQKRLAELGFYDNEITGYFGELTEEAYKNFQQAANVTIDGIAGESDLDILYSDSAPMAEKQEETESPVEEPTEEETEEVTEEATEESTEDDGVYTVGEQGDEVVNIQNRLAELGFFSDVATGYYGDLTFDSIVAFQIANSIIPTGIVDQDTYDALFDENAVANINESESTEKEPTETNDNEIETENDSLISTDSINNTVTATKNFKVEMAGNAIKTAQKSILKTNKIAEKALAGISTVSSAHTAETNNKVFLLWLLIVGGIVIISGGIIAAINKKNKYECAHIKGRTSRTNKNTNVRYW